MILNLKLYDAEILTYILDKEIYCRDTKSICASDLIHLKKIIEIQIENYKEHLIDELKKQYRAGETPSTCSLQRKEGLGYSKAAKIIEQAKAEVEHERRLAEYRKEQNNGLGH